MQYLYHLNSLQLANIYSLYGGHLLANQLFWRLQGSLIKQDKEKWD